MGGVAFGLSLKGSLPSDPASIALVVGTGILNFGTLINSAGRVFNTVNTPQTDPGTSTAGVEPHSGSTETEPGKRPPISSRVPAFGKTTTGVGGIIGGAAGIVVGIHQKAAGDVELGNINIANSAFTLTAGTADTVEGGINAFGLGGIAVRGAELGDWAALADGIIDTPLAIAAFGLGIAGVAIGLKKENDADVSETRSVDADLKQYENLRWSDNTCRYPGNDTDSGRLGRSAQQQPSRQRASRRAEPGPFGLDRLPVAFEEPGVQLSEFFAVRLALKP